MTAGRPLAKMRRVSRSRNKFPWNCAPLKYKSPPITSSSSTIPAMGSSHNLKKACTQRKKWKHVFSFQSPNPKMEWTQKNVTLSCPCRSQALVALFFSTLFCSPCGAYTVQACFVFFSSYVGSGLAMAISKDINEQWPALSSLSRNPDVLASQGKVSGKRVEIYNWTHITFFSPADRAIFPIPSTHRHTLTSAEQWEESVIPIVQKKNFLLFF